MGTSVKERPPKKTSVIMPSSLLSAIVGEQAEPVRMRIAMAINYFKGTEPVSDIETLDLVVNVLLANFRDDIDDVKKFQGLVNTSASFATGALQGLAPGRTFVAPRPNPSPRPCAVHGKGDAFFLVAILLGFFGLSAFLLRQSPAGTGT